MQRYLITLTILYFFCVPAQATRKKIQPVASRGIAFFVDYTEKVHDDSLPFSYQAIPAFIRSESAPAVISNNLLYNALSITPSLTDDLEDWKIYKITDMFVLVVPSHLIVSDKTEQLVSGLSKRELILGLKIDHYTTLDETERSDKKTFRTRIPATPLLKYNENLNTWEKHTPAIGELIAQLPNLFVTNNDYATAQKIGDIPSNFEKPQWLILADAHGTPHSELATIIHENRCIIWHDNPEETDIDEVSGSLSGMCPSEVKELLAFCNKQINTAATVFTSCFSGGENLHDFLQDWSNNGKTLENYRFPIIAFTATSTPVWQLGAPDYERFFKAASAKKPSNISPKTRFDCRNYLNLIKTITSFYDDQEEWEDFDLSRQDSSPQIPCIKFPNRNWIELIESPDATIFSISKKTVCKQRGNPLSISRIDETLPAVITLQTQKITCPLTIERTGKRDELPQFISLSPGSAVHSFSAIIAPDWSLKEIKKAFTMPNTGEDKIFVVERLHVKDFEGRCIFFNLRPSHTENGDATHLFIAYNDEKAGAFFIEDPTRIITKKKRAYKKYIEKAQTLLKEIQQSRRHRRRNFFRDPLAEICTSATKTFFTLFRSATNKIGAYITRH
ncbi:MAG: hypothetical protein JW725_02520 [Candidatus Babeliaceae bacterium]|nr:hypothetical protein [Candidatus Babeliaceae bacterium]